MPRKCSLVGKCRSMNSGVDEEFSVFSFPNHNDQCDIWIRALPKTMNNVPKNTGVCEKHQLTGYRKNQKKGSDRSRNSLPIFKVIPISYLLQSLVSPSRNVRKQQTIVQAVVALINLQFNVDVTDNFISTYKISDIPPKAISIDATL